jgi:hypothetical protein
VDVFSGLAALAQQRLGNTEQTLQQPDSIQRVTQAIQALSTINFQTQNGREIATQYTQLFQLLFDESFRCQHDLLLIFLAQPGSELKSLLESVVAFPDTSKTVQTRMLLCSVFDQRVLVKLEQTPSNTDGRSIHGDVTTICCRK